MKIKNSKQLRVSIKIIIMTASIVILIALVRGLLTGLLHMSETAATTLMTIGQVVAASIAAIMIIIQLSHESDVQQSQVDIQEAQFILQYNQAFIQDPNMTIVEQTLERSMKSGYKERLITDDNRQLFINYLVYMEGMAPLILSNILRFDHVDDLMAYRYFLAVNNKELQEEELMSFPDFYKGCFKLYGAWKKYRKQKGYPILQEKQSLDKWLEYEKYIDSEYTVRKAQPEDVREIAGVLYGTDPYIYPTAFGSRRNAKKLFPLLMKAEGSVFHYSNIKVIVNKAGSIVGAVCYYGHSDNDAIDYADVLNTKNEKTRHVCDNYFSHLASEAGPQDAIYIAALCVSDKYRGKGAGKMLLKDVVAENHNRTIKLDVLCSNKNAIGLYEECGFAVSGDSVKGYAYLPQDRPDCYGMVRQPSEEWIIKKFE